jgi:tetratricopeptide (TPR) repeat protein
MKAGSNIGTTRLRVLRISGAILSVLIAPLFVSGETNHIKAALLPAEASATNIEAVLPSRASEEHVQILSDKTVTNGVSKMTLAAKSAQYQTALESARKLREGKELKRAESTLIQILESGGAAEEIKRPALLELGLVMQEQKSFPKAQQLYSEYVRRYDKDPSVPEVLLRQAYLYREMGVPVLAQSKFYAVISTCLSLKLEEMEYYQRLVLRAQAEIAETHYLQGNYESALDYYSRLLRLEDVDLERANVLYKQALCYSKLNRLDETVATARLLLDTFPKHFDAPETRFILVESLKKLGRNREAIEELDLLLSSQKAEAKDDPQQWLYWQQRAGNTIANEFYREGDLVSALHIYEVLAAVNNTAEWQMPVWYQIGLLYENLKQPQKASEMYEKVVNRLGDIKEPKPSVSAVAEMAAWRKKNIDWEKTARESNRELSSSGIADGKEFVSTK